MTLIEQLRAARRIKKSVGKFEFDVARPTDLEFSVFIESVPAYINTIKSDGGDDVAVLSNEAKLYLARSHVVDWNLFDYDVVGSGVGEVAPFDSDTFIEWGHDNMAVVSELAYFIFDSFLQKRKKIEDAEKK